MPDMDYFFRAQFVESKVLLSSYLPSPQGDRMGMAHSVKGRFPFLDHKVVELSGRIPVKYKMKALNKKTTVYDARYIEFFWKYRARLSTLLPLFQDAGVCGDIQNKSRYISSWISAENETGKEFMKTWHLWESCQPR